MKNLIDNLKKVKPINYIILFYIISVIVHFSLSLTTKCIDVYPDELRFYDIAKNIFRGEWFVVRGIKLDYQKILYSLFLCPFFAIKDVVLRMKIISLFNCIIMCSSIFPMYILYKYMYDENNRKIGDMLYFLLVAFSSMLFFTITYMSENLYVPLYLWGIVAFFYGIKNNKIIGIILSSIIFYMNYVCREIMLIYFVALLFTILIFIYKKEKNLPKINIAYLVVFVMIPIVLHFILKFTLFSNMGYTYVGGTYDQIGISVLKSPEMIIKLIKSAFYYLSSFGILFLFFPIIILFNEYKKMSIYEKIILISNVINIILMAFVIAYTISIREDLEFRVYRLHLRYSMVSILLISFIMLKHFNIETIQALFKKRVSLIFLGIIFIFSVIFFTGLDTYWIDQTYICWYKIIRNNIFTLMNMKIDVTRTIEMNIIFIIYVGIVLLFYFMKKYNIVKKIMLIFTLLLFIVNNIYVGYNYRIGKMTLPNVYKETKMVIDYFSNKKNKVIFCVGEKSMIMDVYYDDDKNILLHEKVNDFIKNCNGKNKVSELEIVDSSIHKPYINIKHIDYVLVDKNVEMDRIRFNNMTEVKELNLRNYTLYKNDNKNTLNISVLDE